MIESQNLAPSLLAIHKPRTSAAFWRDPQSYINGLVFDLAALSVANFDPKGIKEYERIYWLQSPVCQSETSSKTASVTRLIRSAEIRRP